MDAAPPLRSRRCSGRRWIGIDVTYQSIALILKHFADSYKDDWPAIEATIKLDGVPRDLESAMARADADKSAAVKSDADKQMGLDV